MLRWPPHAEPFRRLKDCEAQTIRRCVPVEAIGEIINE